MVRDRAKSFDPPCVCVLCVMLKGSLTSLGLKVSLMISIADLIKVFKKLRRGEANKVFSEMIRPNSYASVLLLSVLDE